MTTDHLTPIPNATLVAWHSTQDVQAVVIGLTCEELYVDGRYISLPPGSIHPVQQVINYCSIGKRAQKQRRAMWAAL